VKDEDKTKEQLLDEIQQMRQRIIMLEVIEKEHRLTGKQLKQRIEIEEALALASRLFISVDEPDLNQILKIFGEVVNANRSYIFLIREDGRKADNTHEWCDPSTEPQMHNLQGLDSALFPWWMEKLKQRENIVIPDVNALPPDAIAEKEIIQSQGVRSLVVVPIGSKEGKLLGFMGFDDTEKCRTWSEEDIRLLRVASEMIARYLDRKRAEDQLGVSFREKEILLRELYHRTKNNMQIISSLLMLQEELSKDEKVIEMLKDSQNRITSMALVHENLYLSEDLSKISLKEYIDDLVSGLFQSYGVSEGKVALNINVESVFLGIDSAIPCGLIINELISNSLKYAFPEGKYGEIKIFLRSIDENMIELLVGDNGVGIPEDMDFRKTESLGMQLVTMLVENQLHGEIKLDREEGTEFKIKFRGIN